MAMKSNRSDLRVTIIERDIIRRSLHRSISQSEFSWTTWDSSLESKVQWLWECQITDAMKKSHVVIIADTNLDLVTLKGCAKWLRGLGTDDMAIRYFPAKPLIEMIRMDQQRTYPVGASVLRMQLQKIRPESVYLEAVGGSPFTGVV